MRVLLVQSVPRNTVVNAVILRAAGFVVDAVPDLDGAFSFMNQYDHDIIVLDRTAREADSCGLVTRIRAHGCDTPLLMLSGAGEGGGVVQALRAGADDVMTGTLKVDELVARIQAIIRRSNGYGQSVLQIGPLTLDVSAHEASIHGRALHLTRKEFAVLQMLALRHDKVLSKQQILGCLYDGIDDPDISIVGVYICNLRKKLAASGAGTLIETVHGCGFVLRELQTLPAAIPPTTHHPLGGTHMMAA